MTKRKFHKEVLLDLLDCGKGDKVPTDVETANYTELAEFISDKLFGKNRWTLDYELLFRVSDKYYRASYQRGATENQETYPFDSDSDWIDCVEMEPYEVSVTKYRVKR